MRVLWAESTNLFCTCTKELSYVGVHAWILNTQSLIKRIKLTDLIARAATAPSQNPGAAARLICPDPKAASIRELSPMQRHRPTANITRCQSDGIGRNKNTHWVSGSAEQRTVDRGSVCAR